MQLHIRQVLSNNMGGGVEGWVKHSHGVQCWCAVALFLGRVLMCCSLVLGLCVCAISKTFCGSTTLEGSSANYFAIEKYWQIIGLANHYTTRMWNLFCQWKIWTNLYTSIMQPECQTYFATGKYWHTFIQTEIEIHFATEINDKHLYKWKLKYFVSEKYW